MKEQHGPAKPGEQKRSVIDYTLSQEDFALGADNAFGTRVKTYRGLFQRQISHTFSSRSNPTRMRNNGN